MVWARESAWIISRALRQLGRVFNWAIERELLTVNPCHRVSKPKTPSSTKYYTEDEVAQLLAWAAENAPDLHPIIAFAFYTGCRKGEIAALRWSDVDWRGARILVQRSWKRNARKSGEPVVVNMHPHLESILTALRERSGGEGDALIPALASVELARACPASRIASAPAATDRGIPVGISTEGARTHGARRPLGSSAAGRLRRALGLVFPAPPTQRKRRTKPDAPNGWMRDRYDNWGLDDAITAKKVRRFRNPWHAFRHTHATNLAVNGAGLERVQQALGQSTLQMARRYAHLAAEHVRADVAKLPALGPVAPATVASLDEARRRKDTGGTSGRDEADAIRAK